MDSFLKWLAMSEDVAVPGVPSQPMVSPGFGSSVGKPQRANKDQIMQYWSALTPNLPILMQPMMPSHKGSTYSQDGIRVTGSKQFIDGVLSRLKDLINYENQQSKLEVVYREIDSKHPENMRPSSFVFYIMSKQRLPKMKKINPIKKMSKLEEK